MRHATLGGLTALLLLTTPLAAQTVREAPLRNYNQINPTATPATGSARATLDGMRLRVTGSFEGLTSEALNVAGTPGHIHVGGPGANGPIVLKLRPTLPADSLSGTFDDTFDLTAVAYPAGITADSVRSAFQNGNLYVNVHSEQYPGGEIRGQLLPADNEAPDAPGAPDPANTTLAVEGDPAAPFSATWAAATDPDGDDDDDSDDDADSAPVVYVWELATDDDFDTEDMLLAVNTATSTSFTSTFGIVNNILAKAGVGVGESATLYHRVYAQDGALRTAGPTSQVTLRRGRLDAELEALLRGYNQVEPVLTPAEGEVALVLNGTTLTVSGAFDGLTGTLRNVMGTPAHIHLGGPAENGPIVIPLTVRAAPDSLGGSLVAADNTFDLAALSFSDTTSVDDVIGALTGAGAYVNIHSETHPAGEIRGTPLLVNNEAPAPPAHIVMPDEAATLDLAGAGDDSDDDGMNSLRVAYTSRTDPEYTPVVYVWQLSTLRDFAETLVNDNTGRDTTFSVSYAALDSLLAASGVEPGETVTLYHRANVQDGSDRTTGVINALRVTRSMATSGEGGPGALGFVVGPVGPNPTRGAAQVRFALGTAATVGVEVFDVLGRRVATVAPRPFGPGEGHRVGLDLGAVAPGLYVARVTAGDQAQAVRFTVVR